jgi:hypothetical protein
MEATTSATIINNILVNFNIHVVINLVIYAFFVTAAVTLSSKLIILSVQKIIDIMYRKWLTRFHEKRNLALEIIKICTEGSTTGWNIKPRNMEHIYYIARLLTARDKNAGKFFDDCISGWSLNAIKQERSSATKENIEFCIELQKRAQNACEKTVDIVNKWR